MRDEGEEEGGGGAEFGMANAGASHVRLDDGANSCRNTPQRGNIPWSRIWYIHTLPSHIKLWLCGNSQRVGEFEKCMNDFIKLLKLCNHSSESVAGPIVYSKALEWKQWKFRAARVGKITTAGVTAAPLALRSWDGMLESAHYLYYS